MHGPILTGEAALSCDVFISYRRSDRADAERLYQLLQERGITAWYDALIVPGADWRDAIVSQLGGAKLMVILLSAAALESDELKKELAVADQQNVPLLAVRLEDVKPRAAFAYELARGNWFDVFSDRDHRFEELAQLLVRLTRDSGQIAKTLIASTRARDERRRRDSWGPWRLLRRSAVLAGLVGLVSIGALVLYEKAASPIDQLVSGGMDPLLAYLYVTVAVTVAAPVLAISLIGRGLQAGDIPLLLLAMMNTALICSLAAALIRDLRMKLNRMLEG